MLDTDIICKFGRFGTSKGSILSNNQITCPTPNTKLNLEEIGEEPVKVEVAMNGQDFVTPKSVYFKFVGSKSPSNYGVAWFIAIIIGAIVLLFLLYFITKAFSGSEGGAGSAGAAGGSGVRGAANANAGVGLSGQKSYQGRPSESKLFPVLLSHTFRSLSKLEYGVKTLLEKREQIDTGRL